MELSAPLREADERMALILSRFRLAEHLNPINAAEARAGWKGGAGAPRLLYEPVTWGDEALHALDQVRAPGDHPLGEAVNRIAEEFRAFVVALRDRTEAAFDALARIHAWYPEPIDAPTRIEPNGASTRPAAVSATGMMEVLQRALDARGMVGWSTRLDARLASRVLVDAPRREVRINPRATFRPADAVSLVAHEIDVHVRRSVNGGAQSLAMFATGLPGSLATEEGLAVAAEERVGVSTRHLLDRQALVASAVLLARHTGFADVHTMLAERVGPEAAWVITVRVKRGLAAPDAPGVFAKDAVYHIGYHAVQAWLAGGGCLASLYVGKVGLHHPVSAWISAGWVVPQPVPALWALSPPGSGCA